MLIIISPAKTLDFDTPPNTEKHSQPDFLTQSQILIDILAAYSDVEIAKLMKLSDKLAGLNLSRYQSWAAPFDLDNAKQAVLAFKGDVYTGLDADSLDADGLDYAQTHLRILSGLYGILRPLDLMQAYRLEMGTKLSTNKGKDLYAFWGDMLRQSLEAESALADGVLINLASNEYSKVIQLKQFKGRIITPIFKDWKNGQYKIISFYAKKARGLMSRYIIDQRLETPEGIKSFDSGGYQFNAELSSGDDWVFIRNKT